MTEDLVPEQGGHQSSEPTIVPCIRMIWAARLAESRKTMEAKTDRGVPVDELVVQFLAEHGAVIPGGLVLEEMCRQCGEMISLQLDGSIVGGKACREPRFVGVDTVSGLLKKRVTVKFTFE